MSFILKCNYLGRVTLCLEALIYKAGLYHKHFDYISPNMAYIPGTKVFRFLKWQIPFCKLISLYSILFKCEIIYFDFN